MLGDGVGFGVIGSKECGFQFNGVKGQAPRPRDLIAEPHVTIYSIEGPGREIVKRFNLRGSGAYTVRGRYCPNHNHDHYNGLKAVHSSQEIGRIYCNRAN